MTARARRKRYYTFSLYFYHICYNYQGLLFILRLPEILNIMNHTAVHCHFSKPVNVKTFPTACSVICWRHCWLQFIKSSASSGRWRNCNYGDEVLSSDILVVVPLEKAEGWFNLQYRAYFAGSAIYVTTYGKVKRERMNLCFRVNKRWNWTIFAILLLSLSVFLFLKAYLFQVKLFWS